MTAPRRKGIDWPSARAEYVNNAGLTYGDIAAKYGCLEVTARKRGAEEGWTAERSARATALVQKVTEKATFDALGELTKYNEQDLIAAKAMRDLVGRQMQEAREQKRRILAKDLRALAGAMESAQRIARLALGASTANTDSRATIINEIERMTPEERAEHARSLYSRTFTDKAVQ
jgi:uncharacterized protein YjcR